MSLIKLVLAPVFVGILGHIVSTNRDNEESIYQILVFTAFVSHLINKVEGGTWSKN